MENLEEPRLFTGVFVVMDFGVRGRRTDLGASGLLGSTASAATCWTQKVKDTDPGPAHENGEFADNEVASHPLIANLSQEI